MHNIKKLGLQAFATTGTNNVQVIAREIDFVSSFSKNLQSLLDVMGISRMIKKENGSELKIRKTSGTLESGDVGEGEEITASTYDVVEEAFDTIRIKKYRKSVSIEAIADKGYEAAVEATDEEFKSDLQASVQDAFFTQLKAGTLTGNETTWQMAVAMAIGKVKDKFKKMKRTATGVAVWVNTLDVYRYVGAADITIQTAFGMDYIKNFMGADVVYISSDVPENTVIATPLNNIVCYYVDPANSEFAQAGLAFTTDGDTGFIGFHTEGTYNKMISDNYAIMGVRLFAEYIDAIANIAVGSAVTQTLGDVKATSAAGSETGKTAITIGNQKESIRNGYKYKVADAATSVTLNMNVKTWSKWDGVSEIAATAGKHITIVEHDSNYLAVRSGDVVAK